MKRVAAEQAPCGASSSLKKAELFDSLGGVFRACGSEATRGTQPGRDNQLVNSDQFQRESPAQTHTVTPRSDSNSERTSVMGRSFADRRGFTTKSNPLGISSSDVRMISLTLLLIRFLSWAFPNLRGVVKPKRLYSRPFSSANTAKERDVRFAPLRYTA